MPILHLNSTQPDDLKLLCIKLQIRSDDVTGTIKIRMTIQAIRCVKCNKRRVRQSQMPIQRADYVPTLK